MPNLLFHFNRSDAVASLRERRLLFMGNRSDKLNFLAESLLVKDRNKKQEEWEDSKKEYDDALKGCKELFLEIRKNPSSKEEALDALEKQMKLTEQKFRDEINARLQVMRPSW